MIHVKMAEHIQLCPKEAILEKGAALSYSPPPLLKEGAAL
jgi:hypothetical protein